MVSGTPVEPAAESESAPLSPGGEPSGASGDVAPPEPDASGSSEANDAPDDTDSLEPPDAIEAVIQRSVDDALARWEATFGAAGADLDVEDDDDFDAREHLVSAAMHAAADYLSAQGIASTGSVLKVDTTLLAVHGVPLMTAVFGAIDASLTDLFRDLHDGRKPKTPPKVDALELDFSELFDGPQGPSEPSRHGGRR